MKRDTHVEMHAQNQPACTHVHCSNHTHTCMLFPYSLALLLQQCTFISELIGAAVSKLKKNIQYALKFSWSCSAGTRFLSPTKQQASNACRAFSPTSDRHSWRARFGILPHCIFPLPLQQKKKNTSVLVVVSGLHYNLLIYIVALCYVIAMGFFLVMIACPCYLMNYNSPLHTVSGGDLVSLHVSHCDVATTSL